MSARVPRFFCPHPLTSGVRLPLPESAGHHAVRVLRLGPGAVVQVFDGEGSEFRARILRVDRDAVTVELDAPVTPAAESPLAITLVQGISSGERMDYTLQKSVELGVVAIQPVATERSVVRLAGERAEKRRAHWQRVVIGACEQCGRARVPPVAPILAFADWLSRSAEAGQGLLLAPEVERRLSTLQRPAGPILLLVGPEGGLTPAERALAIGRGFTPVRLGPRILRTETAALAAIAAMHALWGDF